jgi:4-amino-4-deoxy-L-arabinose transferase-like glycosyltransferase
MESRADVNGEAGEGLRGRSARFLRDHWPVLVLCVIMAGAFLLRLYYLSRHTEYTADSYYFLILARSIRDTFTYTVRGIVHTKYLPGFPVFIWMGSYIFGGIENAANAIALLGGALTVITTYGIGRELFNKWAGLVAALIIGLQPTFLKWTSLPMTEGLFTFLFSAGIYLLITGCRRASMPRRMLGALCGGLCLLTRWEGILFFPLMVLVVILYIRGSRLEPWEPFVLTALFGLPIGVYVARNLITTGRITAYMGEYKEYSEPLGFAVLKSRFKAYAWNGMTYAVFSAFFYAGSLWCLLRKKWKPFLVIGGWFALFVGFHLFWYYTYERFMTPAAPAVALMTAFLLVDVVQGGWRLFAPGGRAVATLRGKGLKERAATRTGNAIRVAWAGIIACALVFLLVSGLVAADRVIQQNYKAFADDHGGRGMEQAAEWLKENVTPQTVAVDAGPYFNWLYYPGDVIYLRPVPWDLPVEDRDIDYPDVPDKLYRRGVRYMVIGQTEKGVDDELNLFGIVGDERSRIREVARWENHYDYPEPHDLETVIFEVLPPP